MAPPRVVDYQPETDELALLQTLGGEADEEEEEEEGGEDADMLDGDGGGVEAARRRRVSCWGWGQLRRTRRTCTCSLQSAAALWPCPNY